MPVQLNHTIVASRDRHESAAFYTDLLGLPPHTTYGPFAVVELANDVSLDFIDDPEIHQRHYAFLVSEQEFDEIFGRIQERGLPYWADPHEKRPGETNTNDGGRGVYWNDPNGHKLEILTVPYGGWPDRT
jgi:catechol 2,3-dioxygenase-like lactoylglutathione lyase family enzyme